MIAMCSGGFSVLHVGHLELLEQASSYGKVIVALNSDAWLKRKYGYVVVPWIDRSRLLKALRVVEDVVPVQDDDGTVSEAIRRIKPDFFLNGGDRVESEATESAACMDCGTKIIFVKTPAVHSGDILKGHR